MDKHKECRVLRAKLRDLYEDSIDAAKFGVPTDEIDAKITFLQERLSQLEQSIGKNKEYEGLEVPEPSGFKILGEVIGICGYCEKEVYSGRKYPDPKEGLFCSYYCRKRNRKKQKDPSE
ncbi:hypothetical protein [Paenibacillus medicaginis]|uniref:DksA C4-type domain-containing protein n=1 Tax=Paenibacillus medicaginis TaxID=1470560 RepID=A0ABV5C0V1_9BACL